MNNILINKRICIVIFWFLLVSFRFADLLKMADKVNIPTKKTYTNENGNGITKESGLTNENGSNENGIANKIPQTNSNHPTHLPTQVNNHTINLTNDEDDEDSEPVEEVVPFEDENRIKYPLPEGSTKHNFGYNYDVYIYFLHALKANGRNYRITNPYNIPITAGILYDTLRETEWFNGDVINLHFKLCEVNNESVHAVDSYFYNSHKSRGCKGLESYIKSIKYSTYKIILFPFNMNGNHWPLYYANIQQKQLLYYDSYTTTRTKLNSIFVKGFFTLIEMSNLYHNMEPLNLVEWKMDFGQCPQQTNNYDCGVFSCCAATALSRGVEPSCTQEYMYFYRHIIAYRIHWFWWKGYKK